MEKDIRHKPPPTRITKHAWNTKMEEFTKSKYNRTKEKYYAKM
jgi:hypothetical protein